MRKRVIVCAANRIKSGLIVLGVRHCDELMHSQVRDLTCSEQGFIDNDGDFLTREEAWGVAAMADQIMAANKARLKSQLGTVGKADMQAVEDAIRVHLGMAI